MSLSNITYPNHVPQSLNTTQPVHFQLDANTVDNESNAYFCRAITFYQLRQFSEAKEALQKAVELNPNNNEAYLNLVTLFLLLKEPVHAKELLRKKNYTLHTESPTLLYDLYKVLCELKMLTPAARIAKKLFRITPQLFIDNISLLDPLKQYLDLCRDMEFIFNSCIKIIDKNHKNYINISLSLDKIRTAIHALIIKKNNLQVQKNEFIIQTATVSQFIRCGAELGIAQSQLNEFESAKATFEEVIIIAKLYSTIGRLFSIGGTEKLEQIKLLLGITLIELHDFEYAIIVLEEIIEKSQDNYQAKELLIDAKARYNNELQIANTNTPKIEQLENHECVEDSLLDTLEVAALCNEYFGLSD